MHLLRLIFTWWNGATAATRFFSWTRGELVGTDDFGNTYYRTRGGAIDPALGFERRWVIFSGVADGSLTPPGWYGWLHHTVDTPPCAEDYAPREWQLPHLPNMTGTPQAYRPTGSAQRDNARPTTVGDYDAWTPN